MATVPMNASNASNTFWVSSTATSTGLIADPSSFVTTATTWATPCPSHVTSPDNVEYLDGLVVTYCLHCNARIAISRLPGGVNAVHARELAERLIVAFKEDGPSGEALSEFADLKRAVKQEMETLDEVLALLRTVEILLDE